MLAVAACGERGIHLYAILLAHVYIAVSSVQGKVVEEMPLQDSLDSVQTLTAEIGVFEVVLHIVNMPYALYLVTELINVSIYIHEETIMGVFCSQREIMVLLWLQVFATPLSGTFRDDPS